MFWWEFPLHRQWMRFLCTIERSLNTLPKPLYRLVNIEYSTTVLGLMTACKVLSLHNACTVASINTMSYIHLSCHLIAHWVHCVAFALLSLQLWLCIIHLCTCCTIYSAFSILVTSVLHPLLSRQSIKKASLLYTFTGVSPHDCINSLTRFKGVLRCMYTIACTFSHSHYLSVIASFGGCTWSVLLTKQGCYVTKMCTRLQ